MNFALLLSELTGASEQTSPRKNVERHWALFEVPPPSKCQRRVSLVSAETATARVTAQIESHLCGRGHSLAATIAISPLAYQLSREALEQRASLIVRPSSTAIIISTASSHAVCYSGLLGLAFTPLSGLFSRSVPALRIGTYAQDNTPPFLALFLDIASLLISDK